MYRQDAKVSTEVRFGCQSWSIRAGRYLRILLQAWQDGRKRQSELAKLFLLELLQLKMQRNGWNGFVHSFSRDYKLAWKTCFAAAAAVSQLNWQGSLLPTCKFSQRPAINLLPSASGHAPSLEKFALLLVTMDGQEFVHGVICSVRTLTLE